jgi:hypothetical protein
VATPLTPQQRKLEARAKPFERALTQWLIKYGDLVLRQELSRGVSKADTERSLRNDLSRLLELFGVRAIEEAGSSIAGTGWAIPPKLYKEYIAAKEVKLTGIMAATREAVRGSVRRVVLDAETESPQPSAGEIARRIRTQYHGDADQKPFTISSERAALIARTELVQAQNTGIVEGYRATGVKRIEWLAYRDGKSGERHHEKMHGVIINLGDYFETPLGNKLRYPGDPSGPIADTANCRCSAASLRN